jgi:protein TonB
VNLATITLFWRLLAMVGGALAVDRIRLPLALSVIGHAVVLALLILLLAETRPSPKPAVPGGVEVVLSQAPQQTRAVPAPEAPAEPAPSVVAPLPPKVAAVMEPERSVEATEPLPTPPIAAETETPLPPRKPVVREAPKQVMRRLERPRAPVSASTPAPVPTKFAEMHPAGVAGAQYSAAQAAPAVTAPARAPGPDVTASYQAVISAWLESHKRYPESARERGEEGSAALRFRVDRSGRVLDYSYASTGYADLDAGLDEMMRGAQLPPFPPGMAASRIEASVTMRFNLTR